MDANHAVSQAKAAAIDIIQASNNQPCMLAQNQAREADIIALSEMNRALDRKVIQFSTCMIDEPIFEIFYFLSHINPTSFNICEIVFIIVSGEYA